MHFIVFKFSSILLNKCIGAEGLVVEVSSKADEELLLLKLLPPERIEKSYLSLEVLPKELTEKIFEIHIFRPPNNTKFGNIIY